ncbi:basic proline-rich protein-like [Mustela erminea]|uniref:basic proline-rich protein-like n=1 Tax=Mustela erminea TaxID=36723 RepID=UPI0013874558|nr:basic proline-rich protein-like [Mustela erminea]
MCADDSPRIHSQGASCSSCIERKPISGKTVTSGTLRKVLSRRTESRRCPAQTPPTVPPAPSKPALAPPTHRPPGPRPLPRLLPPRPAGRSLCAPPSASRRGERLCAWVPGAGRRCCCAGRLAAALGRGDAGVSATPPPASQARPAAPRCRGGAGVGCLGPGVLEPPEPPFPAAPRARSPRPGPTPARPGGGSPRHRTARVPQEGCVVGSPGMGLPGPAPSGPRGGREVRGGTPAGQARPRGPAAPLKRPRSWEGSAVSPPARRASMPPPGVCCAESLFCQSSGHSPVYTDVGVLQLCLG